MSPDYIRPVPTINLTADELAAVTAAIRRAIEDDRFPHAPRLDPLRAALGKFEAAPEPTPLPKAPPPAKVDKRGVGEHKSRLSLPYDNFAPVIDRLRSRLWAVREQLPQLRKFRIAVPLDQPRNVVAPEPAAWGALDRKRGDAKIREGMGVISHGGLLRLAKGSRSERDLRHSVNTRGRA